MNITIATRIGIITLLTFSMPFSTPKRTTIAVIPMNTENHKTGSPACAIKLPKKASEASAVGAAPEINA